jgi:hypothetical protein
MRPARFLNLGAVLLALTIVLAACAGAADDPESSSAPPSRAPSPTNAPSVEPSPSEAPSLTGQPSPDPVEVVEFELPMIARSTADGVEVHAVPGADAPLLIGEAFPDMNRVEVLLAADELVAVSLGPVYFEGTSWYQVSAVDGGDKAFAYGWVPAESIARESDAPEGGPQVVTIHGLGTGTDVSAPVLAGTPVTVDFAAAPTPDSDSCELDVTVIRTDGLAVNVATQTITEPVAFQFAASIEGGGMQGLFQDEAGDVTLQVETDCSFAASLSQPSF